MRSHDLIRLLNKPVPCAVSGRPENISLKLPATMPSPFFGWRADVLHGLHVPAKPGFGPRLAGFSLFSDVRHAQPGEVLNAECVVRKRSVLPGACCPRGVPGRRCSWWPRCRDTCLDDLHRRPTTRAPHRRTWLDAVTRQRRDEFEQQMQQGDQVFAVRMQKAEIARPSKALGQDVLQDKPQKLRPAHRAQHHLAALGIAIAESDLAIGTDDDVLLSDHPDRDSAPDRPAPIGHCPPICSRPPSPRDTPGASASQRLRGLPRAWPETLWRAPCD